MFQGGTQNKKHWRSWEELYRSRKIDPTIEIVQDDGGNKTPSLRRVEGELRRRGKDTETQEMGLFRIVARTDCAVELKVSCAMLMHQTEILRHVMLSREIQS